MITVSVFAMILGTGFVFSIVPRESIVLVPLFVNFIVWTLLGFLLTGIALYRGVRDPGNEKSLTDPFEWAGNGCWGPE